MHYYQYISQSEDYNIFMTQDICACMHTIYVHICTYLFKLFNAIIHHQFWFICKICLRYSNSFDIGWARSDTRPSKQLQRQYDNKLESGFIAMSNKIEVRHVVRYHWIRQHIRINLSRKYRLGFKQSSIIHIGSWAYFSSLHCSYKLFNHLRSSESTMQPFKKYPNTRSSMLPFQINPEKSQGSKTLERWKKHASSAHYDKYEIKQNRGQGFFHY